MRSAFERLFSRQTQPPNLPYIPRPGQIIPPPEISPEPRYQESEADLDGIHGSSILFGLKETLQIDEQGNARKVAQRASHILGSGKRVSRIEDIGGICRPCQETALQAYQEGKLSFEQMQLHSFFDAESGRRCDRCGHYFCSCHCKPIEIPEGVIHLCADCSKLIQSQQFRKKILKILAFPFAAILSLFVDSSEDQQA